jgi:hypothetical protein
VVILEEVEEITTAVVLLNRTTLLAAIALKLVPVITTGVPTAPLPGLKPVIVGVGSTVKFEALGMVTPLVITEIGPEPAPAGTVVVMLVAFEADTTELTPLN